MDINITTPDGEELYAVVDLAEQFCKENATVTFARQRALFHLCMVKESKETEVFVAHLDGVPAGFAIGGYDSDFTVERFAYVMKFYVAPFARGTRVARELTRELTQWFDDNNCQVAYATATGGVGQDKQFTNLFCKFGFKVDSVVLKRG